MLKPFNELMDLDVSKYISKKPTFKYNKATGKTEQTGKFLDYLSWVDVLTLLYQNGAEKVRYGNIVNEHGHSLFLSGDSLPEVRIYLEIDQDRYEMTYPVIEGSSDVKMDKIMQSDIHNATQRAFVKCVAINTGLGISLWKKEEEEKQSSPKFDESMHSIQVCIDRVKKKYGSAVSSYGSERDVNEAAGVTSKQLKTIFDVSRNLLVLEDRLDKMV